jgi:hypothetical protein
MDGGRLRVKQWQQVSVPWCAAVLLMDSYDMERSITPV